MADTMQGPERTELETCRVSYHTQTAALMWFHVLWSAHTWDNGLVSALMHFASFKNETERSEKLTKFT